MTAVPEDSVVNLTVPVANAVPVASVLLYGLAFTYLRAQGLSDFNILSRCSMSHSSTCWHGTRVIAHMSCIAEDINDISKFFASHKLT